MNNHNRILWIEKNEVVFYVGRAKLRTRNTSIFLHYVIKIYLFKFTCLPLSVERKFIIEFVGLFGRYNFLRRPNERFRPFSFTDKIML